MTDSVAAALDEIRDRGYHNGKTGATAHRLSDCAAEDAPRLLAALDAVLARHQPLPSTVTRCSSCRMPDGGRVFWPCPEYQAISAALLGE